MTKGMFVVNKGDVLMSLLALFMVCGFIYTGISAVGQEADLMFATRELKKG